MDWVIRKDNLGSAALLACYLCLPPVITVLFIFFISEKKDFGRRLRAGAFDAKIINCRMCFHVVFLRKHSISNIKLCIWSLIFLNTLKVTSYNQCLKLELILVSKILSTSKPEEAKLLLLSSPCLVGTNNKKLAHPGELNWLSHTSKKILASIEIKVSLPTNQANYLLQIIARQGYIVLSKG